MTVIASGKVMEATVEQWKSHTADCSVPSRDGRRRHVDSETSPTYGGDWKTRYINSKMSSTLHHWPT